ncbi:MAG: site-specific integrase [Candidatus Micrarchaeota archaeon]|nr:site-specific integrase [Candidatus Micrarchaeota archaeon]
MQEFKSLPLHISKPTLKESSESYTKEEFEPLINTLKQVSMRVSWHQLRELQSILHTAQTKRFKGKRKTPKYGSLNKGFTDAELERFLSVITNDKFRLLFSYQAYLGLRVGEAIRLSLTQINLKTRELTLKTEKAKVIDTLLVPLPLFNQTVEYIKKHLEEIERAKGYLFFKEDTGKDGLFLDSNYVRNKFRKYVVKAGLDEVYDTSDESDDDRTPRRLHRLTTHSLRHHAICAFSKQTNGNVVLTSRFARHSEPTITMTYIHTSKDELYKEIDSAFSLDEVVKLKERLR